MIRLLTRVYLLLLILLALGLAVPSASEYLLWDTNSESLRQIYSGPLRSARDLLQQADDPTLEAIRLQRKFEHPLELLYLNSNDGIPRWIDAYLEEDAVLLDFDDHDRLITYLRFDEERVLRYGPLPRIQTYGREGFLMTALLMLVGGYLLVRLLVHPLSKQSKTLATAAKQISDGHLGTRIRLSDAPHSPRLVQAFNSMTSRIEKLLVSQRQLLQDVSHELRTPLARLRFGLEILNDDEADPEERQRVSAKLDAAIQQLDNLVEEILQYTRLADKDQRKLDEDPIVLEELLGNVVKRFALASEEGKSIEIRTPDRPLPTIAGNSRELSRAVDNLIANAVRFADSQIRVDMRVDKEFVCIAVGDDGPGIPENKRERVLQPFVQLERSSNHNGLGLAIVERIAQAHGGRAVVGASSDLGGAEVQVYLPLD